MPGSPDARRNAAILALLVLLPLLIFSRCVRFDFVWDDKLTNLCQNPRLKKETLQAIAEFWQRPYMGLYIPATYTTWALLKSFGGLVGPSGTEGFNPAVFHLANLVIHVANGLLVFLILRKLLRRDACACLGGLLFLLHPVQVESVAWVSELRGVQSTFFALLSVHQYLEYRGQAFIAFYSNGVPNGADASGSPRRPLFHYVASFLAFVLAVLSKPSATVLPLLLLVLDLCFVRQHSAKRLLPLIPWFLTSALASAATLRLQADSAVAASIPLWSRLVIFSDTFDFYLAKLLCPIALSAVYGRTPESALAGTRACVSWIPLLLVLCGAWSLGKRYPAVLLSLTLFVVGYLPVSGLFPFQFQYYSTVADRYLYLAMLGPAFLLGWLGGQFGRSRSFWLISGLALSLLSGFSVARLPTWRDGLSLWRDVIAKRPDQDIGYHNLGCELFYRDRQQESYPYFLKALELNPDSAEGQLMAGLCLKDAGKYSDALERFLAAARLCPGYAKAHNHAGLTLMALGNPGTAVEQFTRAIRFAPGNAEYHRNLGTALIVVGDPGAAAEHFAKSLEIDPGSVESHFKLAEALSRLGRHEAAIRHYQDVVRLRPSFAEAHNNLGNLFAQAGQSDAAIRHYLAALRARPGFVEPHKNLGVLFYRLGRYSEAVEHLSAALRLRPDDAFCRDLITKAREKETSPDAP
jgi:tetratricopeptide (TPR) repeat protein